MLKNAKVLQLSIPTFLRWTVAGICCAAITNVMAAVTLQGQVLDVNGFPVRQAMLTWQPSGKTRGATATTVFTNAQGEFVFPQSDHTFNDDDVSAKALNYQQLRVIADTKRKNVVGLTVVMQHSVDQSDVAPASAWLRRITDDDKRTEFVRNCVGCHQVPAPEVRHYAQMIEAMPGDNKEQIRQQSWTAIVKYMNFLSREEFARADPSAVVEHRAAYSIGNGESIVNILSESFAGGLDRVEGYDYGAPLLTNDKTVIREYEVPRPNAVREALLMGKEKHLWVADVASNNLIRVDPTTGKQKILSVPANVPVGPHTLHPGSDGSVWVAPLFNGVVAKLNPDSEQWKLWYLKTDQFNEVGIHDLSFGASHELLTSSDGRIWFSDIINNAVGAFDPATGDVSEYPIPAVEGRDLRESVYGLAMTSDRKHVWFSQLGIGTFGVFNTETLQFEDRIVLPSIHAGPRRLAVDENDRLYVPLYGAGQLVVYDTKARNMLGTYDLPDRASAPYAVTWDAVRQVAWIPASNGNVIYQFNPRTEKFAVLPLPRAGGLLRMVQVDKETGHLITSYANLLENVHGPRMALIIEPGDDFQSTQTEKTPMTWR